MTTIEERREVARRLRELADYCDENEMSLSDDDWPGILSDYIWPEDGGYHIYDEDCRRLADLIEPSYKPDAKYEAWYNSLSHYGDERGGPSTIRELIEEIVWTALTVDLGPNGNTDPSTGIDEGGVYTNKLFAEWEREASRLSGGIDREALLELAEEMEEFGNLPVKHPGVRVLHNDDFSRELGYARRIREAVGA